MISSMIFQLFLLSHDIVYDFPVVSVILWYHLWFSRRICYPMIPSMVFQLFLLSYDIIYDFPAVSLIPWYHLWFPSCFCYPMISSMIFQLFLLSHDIIYDFPVVSLILWYHLWFSSCFCYPMISSMVFQLFPCITREKHHDKNMKHVAAWGDPRGLSLPPDFVAELRLQADVVRGDSHRLWDMAVWNHCWLMIL